MRQEKIVDADAWWTEVRLKRLRYFVGEEGRAKGIIARVQARFVVSVDVAKAGLAKLDAGGT